MTRDQLILLLQPYKNGLLHKKKLQEALSGFVGLLCGLCEKYPRLKFNVAMPAYMLENADAFAVSQIRNLVTRGNLECLCTGYTEPFFSFSPHWLTEENVALGVKTFAELTGVSPTGFVAPFSNWEPSHIDLLNNAQLQYAVVSSALLENRETQKAGYWFTEYTGSSMAVFPAWSYSARNAPKNITAWLKENFHKGNNANTAALVTLKYMYSLEDDDADGKGWLENIAAEIDKHILEIQPLRFKDAFDTTPPLGLHYFPSSLIEPHCDSSATPYFLNRLHSYDQISIMQRKLMDVCDGVSQVNDYKQAAPLKKKLFFAQDINRFLPNPKSGFCVITDRLWTYGKLIDVERELYKIRNVQNGVIRLTDFLRNGDKSIIMANGALKLYIDHKNGAHVYGLDYADRTFNACAGYCANGCSEPYLFSPRKSKLGFRDSVFAGLQSFANVKSIPKDASNFADSQFEYIFKNSPTGVKVLLNCGGGFTDGEGGDKKHYQLTMDKVFGLEKDAALSYSYKLGNPSLADYVFTFATELSLAFSGCENGNVQITCDKKTVPLTANAPVVFENVTEWSVEDNELGVFIEFVAQKKTNIHISMQSANEGVTLLMSYPIELAKNSSILLTGIMKFQKIKARGAHGESL